MRRKTILIVIAGLFVGFSLGCGGPNMTVEEQPALLRAVEQGNAEELGNLLASGVDVNVRGMNGDTALHVAAEKGDLASMQLLSEYGADFAATNNAGYTPDDVAELAGMDDAAAFGRQVRESLNQ